MNGDQQQFISELDKRIFVMEKLNERWERMMASIFLKLDKIPCDVHALKIKNVEEGIITNRKLYVGGVILIIIVAIVTSMFNGKEYYKKRVYEETSQGD